MKIGTNDISDCKLGNTQINKVYLGNNLVWEKNVAALLLDLYPNAAAAYSLRKLRTAYAGSAIRVRESGLDAEADIGFDANGNLDTAALLAHCGANDGFVTAWYDQSGNANNATNATDGNQPKIVNSGSIIINEGNTSISFDGTNDSLVFTQITAISIFVVEDTSASAGRGFLTNTSNSNTIGYSNVANTRRVRISNVNYEFSGLFSGNSVNSIINTSGNVSYYVNSIASLDNPTAIPSNMDFNSLMNRENTLPISGFLNEIIVYPSDQSSNRTAIESNINTNYNIY